MVALWTGMLLLAADAVVTAATANTTAPTGAITQRAADAATKTPARPCHVISNSRMLSIQAGLASVGDVECVECWLTTDDGDTWRPANCWGLPPAPVSVVVPTDGFFGLYMVAENAAGRSSAPPTAGDAPQVFVLVDSTPPIVQLHGVERVASDAGDSAWSLRLSVIDDNLSPDSIHVFYKRGAPPTTTQPRPTNDTWLDGGTIAVKNGEAHWRHGAAGSEAQYLRVAATDRAGNVGFDEIPLSPHDMDDAAQLIDGRSRAPTGAGSTDWVAPQAAPDLADKNEPIAHVRVDSVIPVAHMEREPLERRRLPRDAETPPPTSAPAERLNADERRALLEAAKRHMSVGEYALAAARLEDYTQGANASAEVLTELGTALYRGGRTEDAIRRYDEALAKRPDDADALDGAALAQATAGRYAAARERLGELLRLRPGSADAWLLLGDVENRLGNLDDALAAWRKTVELNPPQHELVEQARKRLRYFSPTTTRPADSPHTGVKRGR